MVKLCKSVLPEGVDIKCKNDYQTGPVFQLLLKDCYGKCYICEHIPIPPVVEHLIAHKDRPDLKYMWNNMFLACSYCNTVKNKRAFDSGVINPVEVDPEDFISLELSYELKEKVVVSVIDASDNNMLADKTVELLDMVYNNTSNRDNQKVSSATLKNKLSRQLRDFYLLVNNYKTERNSGDYHIIMDEISRKSEFAAFKRMIVRRDPELLDNFKEALL